MALSKKKKTSKKKASKKKSTRKVSKKTTGKKAASKKTASKKTGKKTSKKTASKKRSSASATHSMVPPAAVRSALKKGLELRQDYGGKGLVATTITWARKLAKGEPITVQKARKMNAYFSRHIVDKRAGWDNPPTPGYVAWLLWGGDAARTWVKKVLKAVDAS